MLRVVCWFWLPKAEYRTQFTVGHVNTLRSMVERNYKSPHEFVCITDQTKGFDSAIRVIPLWDHHRKRESIYGPGAPSCYPRLYAYSSDMREIIGERFVSVDLDACITADMAPVWDRKEDFMIWGGKGRRTPWNGSMWMMNAGCREKVWTEFDRDPDRAIKKARGAGFYGSDQAWMNYMLGPHENHWDEDDGVYSYRMHVKNYGGKMPKGCRICFFEGHYDPTHPAVRKTAPWVEEHYR